MSTVACTFHASESPDLESGVEDRSHLTKESTQ